MVGKLLKARCGELDITCDLMPQLRLSISNIADVEGHFETNGELSVIQSLSGARVPADIGLDRA